jgi:hypothetical protein
VSVQTTSAPSASAINYSWHPNNQTVSEMAIPSNVNSQSSTNLPRNDPNDVRSLFALASIPGSDLVPINRASQFFQTEIPDSDSSSDSEDDMLDNKLDLLELERIQNGEALLRNKDGSIRKRKREDYRRSVKKLKHSDPEHINVWMQMINDPNVCDPSSRQV